MNPASRLLVPFSLALALYACMPAGDRLAGSSTEAGNAGGKLSLADGSPASGVEVALVAREFRSDSSAELGTGDREGAYYRTRTDGDGKFLFSGVAPGDYRVIALSGGIGATADSISVPALRDTIFVERVLRPLGGVRGVAKVVGVAERVHVCVGCKSTLKRGRLADTAGAFNLDSLPEGEYDLEPFCASCQPVPRAFRVRIGAGQETVLYDTLKLYPSYFQSFPPADSFTVRPANLPFSIGGKTHYGDQDTIMPLEASWTWEGTPVPGKDVQAGKDGKIQETQVLIDSAFFQGRSSGILRLTLRYPDTTVSRQWRIAYDSESWVWALRLARAEAVARLIGGDHPVWRFRIRETAVPQAADVAFWGLEATDAGRVPAGEVELMVEPQDQVLLEAGTGSLTFILVPDARFGGRVLRPRRDERLADFPNIRLLDSARLGVPGPLEPHMVPEGLVIERPRGPGMAQAYLISRNGKITETLKLPKSLAAVPEAPAFPDSLLLFYRRAPAGSSFVWSDPVRGAGKAWAIDRQGRAWALDTAGAAAPVSLSAEALEALRTLLAPMAGDPPALADDAALPEGRPRAYAWFGGRGRMGDADSDPLLAPLRDWLARAGLASVAAFALPDSAPFRYLSFRADSSGFRYTGDTLLLERDAAAPDRFREYLSAGSPGRAADSLVWSYALRIEGDSLIGSTETAFTSRLFGKLGKRTPLFALADLAPVAPAERFGLPALTSGAGLAGIWEGEHQLGNRILSAPAVKLVPKAATMGSHDAGYLYTPDGGLESQWRFALDQNSADGWDKLKETQAKEGLYDESANHP